MQRPLLRAERQHQTLAAIGLFVAIGLLAFVAPAAAGIWESIRDALLNLLGMILLMLISFLGNLIIILVNVLIGIATYNGFVNAQPVTIGWPLVRDVVNMLFIVVLLVSAFSTIIGYKEFHYTQVLPKLLLMAILINFSKTLLGLMIDFSQVLMLTFVNAFKQAAGGNFITALHLDKITKLRDDDPSYELKDIIGALFLGLVLLGVTLSLVLIMIAFLAMRIIGLWLLLIMSPIAFFALALPGKLKKGFGAFTDDFWSRLTTLLVAGPVMAFFLWLALAIAQGGSQQFQVIGDEQEANNATEQANFSTAVGTPAEIGTFIIAVALMLQGVEFGLKTAQGLSPAVGGLLKTYATPGAIARLRAPIAGLRGAYRYGLRPAGKAVGGVAKGVDTLSGNRISQAVGRAGMRVAARLPYGVGMATMAGLASKRTRGIKEKQSELGKIAADLDPAMRSAVLRTRAGAWVGKQGIAAKTALATDATTSLGMKSRTAAFTEEAKKMGLTGAEQKAWAEYKASQQAADDIKIGKEVATKIGDEATLDKYKEAIKKNPVLSEKWTDLAGIKNASVEDTKRYLGNVSADSIKDSRVFLAHMAALGLVDQETGAFTPEADKDAWEKFMKGRDRGAYARDHIEAFKKDPSQVIAQLRAMDGDEDAIESANKARRFVSKDDSGNVKGIYTNQPSTVKMTPTVVMRNEAVINQGKERLQDMGRRGVTPASPEWGEAVDIKSGMAGAGATLQEAFKFDPGQGVFDNQANREAFEVTVAGFSEGAAAGDAEAIRGLARLDVGSMTANSQNYNEARAAAISSMDIERLRSAFAEAVRVGNKEAQTKIQDIFKMVTREAERVGAYAQKAEVTLDDMETVANNPKSERSVAVIQRLVTAGIGDDGQAVDAARAVVKNQRIEQNVQARAIRGNVKDKARAAAGAVSSGASAAGGAVVAGSRAVGRTVSGAARTTADRFTQEGRARLKERRQEKFESESVAKAERMEEEKRKRGGTAPPESV